MASTVGMYSKVNSAEDTLVRGVRRSSFSLHFPTHRTRRWLLVQWVSVPVIATEEEQSSTHRRNVVEAKLPTFMGLLNDYTNQSWLRRAA